MIEVKLKSMADRLEKSISDIARETGLNRNTVTDLYHNKVDGLKFSTIDALCDTYGMKLGDLLERKELQIGAGPTAKIVREQRMWSPFFAWYFLKALVEPSPEYFDRGFGKIYAFFVRGTVELYFDRNEIYRCAKGIYEQKNLDDVQTVFTRASEQLNALCASYASQSFEKYLTVDLVKSFDRLRDLFFDMLRASAWIDAFDYGFRDEIVGQLTKAHGFTPSETALLCAGGEITSATRRRIQTTSDENELSVLNHVPRLHRSAVKEVLRVHHMRVNPFVFFARLAVWREERDETHQTVSLLMQRIKTIIAGRAHLKMPYTDSLLPDEVDRVPSGLVSGESLKIRSEQSLLIAFDRGEYTVFEGERAVSMQDDLVSRYTIQLAYGNI